MKKNIFLLWLQGWDKAPWLQKKVLESWMINNPSWNIILIDQKNIKTYVSDINYIFDSLSLRQPHVCCLPLKFIIYSVKLDICSIIDV